jgi:hypothetical protein
MARSCRWTPIGPIGLLEQQHFPNKPVMSGRATAIAVHPTEPDTVYVGTAAGGVWKTTDAGRIWRPLTDKEWGPGVGAIALDPSNPARVYVGTGEGNVTLMAFAGEGLLVSDDAGASWAAVPLVGINGRTPRVTSIVVAPAGDRVFIATTSGLFERKRRPPPAPPETWDLTAVVAEEVLVTDLAFDHVSNRLYLAIYGRGVAVWSGAGAPVPLGQSGDLDKRLPDSAQLEAKDFQVSRIALAWIPSEPNVLFVAYAYAPRNLFSRLSGRLLGVFRSDDAGASWRPVLPPPADLDQGHSVHEGFSDSQADYNFVFSRNPHALTDLLLGLVSFYRSTNLGKDWVSDSINSDDDGIEPDPERESLHADQHTIAFSSRGEIWLGNDGGIWRSTNRGKDWRHRNRGLATMQFYGGANHVEVSGIALGGSQDNGAQVYEGHPLWRQVGGGDAGLVAIDVPNRRFWKAGNDSSVAYRDRLHGNWIDLRHVPADATGAFLRHFVLAPSKPGLVYSGTRGLFWAEPEFVPWWFEVPEYRAEGAGSVVALAVAHDDPRRVYVADHNGNIFLVELTDLFSVVFPLPSPASGPIRAITDMAVSPRNSRRLYVVAGELGAAFSRTPRSRLFRYEVATDTWSDLTPALPAFTLRARQRPATENAIHAIVIDPDPAVTDPAQEHVYIGCDVGVFQSRDGGNTWRAFYDGLPPTPVFDLALHPSEHLLRAFTHGRSVWERRTDIEPCPDPPPAGPEIDLYMRDHRYAVGAGSTPVELLDPVRRDGRKPDTPELRPPLLWTAGPDLKVDRESISGETAIDEFDDAEPVEPGFQKPAGTVDYAGGALDCIGFEALAHRDPRDGAKARVYLQVHNRGPDAATGVVARVYYAAEFGDGSWPDLPTGFWETFPAGEPAATSAWKPVGPARTVAEIRPAEPEIVTWEWDVPKPLPETIGFLAIVSAPDDPVFEGQAPGAMTRQIEPLVRTNKRVLLRRTGTVAAAAAGRSWRWLKILGVVVGAGLVGWGLYEALDGD